MTHNNQFEPSTDAGGAPAGRPAQPAKATIIIEATDDVAEVRRRLESALARDGGGHEILVACLAPHRETVETALAHFPHPPAVVNLPPDSDDHAARVLQNVSTEQVAFLPSGVPYSDPPWDELPDRVPTLQPWVGETEMPEVQAREVTPSARGWLASRELLRALPRLGKLPDWELFNLAAAAQEAGRPMPWSSARAAPTAAGGGPRGGVRPVLGGDSSVLALIPHYRCERWLGACLESLLTQSRPPEAVAVIDDNSECPPAEIVRRFPSVTLLAAEARVGPYRLIQEVIDNTRYDAYLFQDADDWSTYDRLELLLGEAERTGAELVGGQELRVMCEAAEVVPVCYPLDVNAALSVRPAHPLLHPTSLVSGALVRRLGGFATGLRFGGDTEFLLRAAHVARVRNVPRYCYFRRHRAASLTTDPVVGLETPVRRELQESLKARARSNASAAARGEPPVLTPYAVTGPVRLTHVLGPKLMR
jgi:Glycosyl transferase family 2